ncbi:MAG: FMN-binding protein [Ruminococcus sp.]|nr:FMN-binding protein [Ruminococcus sp.]
MKGNIKPTIVLTIICTAAALLLVLAYELTKDRISEQREQKFNESVESLFGECETTIIDDNFGYDEIQKIAVTSDGKIVMQICTDGYAKDGINILVGIDESGTLSGISFISLGETPGLGTKVKDDSSFIEKNFIGLSEAPEEIDSISGATFSSKGMKKAVEIAMDAYNENKEVILGG